MSVAVCTLCTLGLTAGSSRMLAQTAPVSGHQDVVFDGREPRRRTPGDSAPAVSPKGISITPDNQILVELAPEDTSDANPFDLNGRTLVFTPDGPGRYSRSVRALAWEDDIGPVVADGQGDRVPELHVRLRRPQLEFLLREPIRSESLSAFH